MRQQSDKVFAELSHLIVEALEGSISAEGMKRLDEMIVADHQARRFYVEYMTVHSGLRKFCSSGSAAEEPDRKYVQSETEMRLLWRALAESERTAEGIKIEKSESDASAEQMGPAGGSRNKTISRFAIYTAVTSAAALLLIAFVSLFVPVRPVIAFYVEQTGARWGDAEEQLVLGDELKAGRLVLDEGIAKLAFLNGTQVLIEAPADFRIESEDRIFLEKGKVCVRVDGDKNGFEVSTLTSKVVDFGTEFGVVVDWQGNTQAHVFEGLVELSGQNSDDESGTVQLKEGQASSVDSTGRLSAGVFEASNTLFVRQMPDGSGGVPGKVLDLADIVAGGNGFGTGQKHEVINPASGVVDVFEGEPNVNSVGSGVYSAVPERKYIDGIFVPNGKDGPVKITSAGHEFADCPETSGYYWCGVAVDGFGVRIGDEQFCENGKAGIILHANSGISFDLDAIRRDIPGVSIDSLVAGCGVKTYSDDFDVDTNCSIWILVDGKLRFQLHGLNEGDPIRHFRVPFAADDRFLTLVSTDGGNGINADWCVFTEPVFRLRARDRQ